MLRYLTILTFTIGTWSCSNHATTVNFELDMRPAIEEGWFTPGEDMVGLRGDQHPLSWSETYLAEATLAEGIYSVSIPFALPTDSMELSYKIKAEGKDHPEDGWQPGRNQRLVIHNGQPQSIQLDWDEPAPVLPATITGHVDIIRDFNSEELPNRDIFIYLPPNYDQSTERYAVLYMHDGQNLFDATNIGQEWGLDEAAEALINSGEIAPLIIVGIGNTANRIDEYTPTRQHWNYTFRKAGDRSSTKKAGRYKTETGEELQIREQSDTLEIIIPGNDEWQTLEAQSDTSYYLPEAGIHFTFHPDTQGTGITISASKPFMGGQGSAYEAFILEQLKPYIDSIYRTLPSPEHTSLGGSSLGGLISLYTGLRHPDIFQNLVILSPSLWWDKGFLFDWVESAPPSAHQKIWLYIGGDEGKEAVNNVRRMRQLLKRKGWQTEYKESEHEQHTETAWKKQASDILRFVAPNNNNR